MKSLRSLGGALSFALVIGMLASAVPVGAQTLNSLTMERTIQLTDIKTTITPTGIPPNVLAAITSGALEVREQSNYNPQAAALTSTTFVVPVGSPTPTAIGALPANSVIASVTMSIDKIYVTSNTVQLVGSISQSSQTPYGNYQGYPATFSFGFTKDTPPKINNVIESVAGTIMLYSASATGTFTITLPPTPPGGGGGGTGVTIVVNGITGATASFQTTVNQMTLNASASTSTNAGALTYAWSIPAGSPSAGISFPGGNTATPLIQLTSGLVQYTIVLTVTDSTGAMATMTITIQYI